MKGAWPHTRPNPRTFWASAITALLYISPVRDRARNHHRNRGFTLVEMMSVIAIVGVLTAVAVLQIRPSAYAGSTKGFADQIASLGDQVRARALSSQRIQRLQFEEGGIIHYQAQSTGLGTPTGWDELAQVRAPGDITIRATSDRTHLNPNDSVPAAGSGLSATLDFSPDGSASAMTIFVGDGNDKTRARVTFFGATGTARVFIEW